MDVRGVINNNGYFRGNFTDKKIMQFCYIDLIQVKLKKIVGWAFRLFTSSIMRVNMHIKRFPMGELNPGSYFLP